MCARLPAVLCRLLYWTLRSLSVCTVFLPLTSSSSSVTAHLCMPLPPFLISVPVSVAVGTMMMVFVGFFVWFDVADLFARGRGTGFRFRFRFRFRLWLRFGFGALVLVWLVASSPRRAVLLVMRRWGRVVRVIASLLVLHFLLLLHVGGLFVRRGLAGTSVASSSSSTDYLQASRVWPWSFFDVTVGRSVVERNTVWLIYSTLPQVWWEKSREHIIKTVINKWWKYNWLKGLYLY